MSYSPLIETLRNTGLVADHHEAIKAVTSVTVTRIQDRWVAADVAVMQGKQRRQEEVNLPNHRFSSRKWRSVPRGIDRSRYGNHHAPNKPTR